LGAPSTAGSQGASSAAQPSSPGASSQQVVVNPSAPPATRTDQDPVVTASSVGVAFRF
jgi:hypothetical protein